MNISLYTGVPWDNQRHYSVDSSWSRWALTSDGAAYSYNSPGSKLIKGLQKLTCQTRAQVKENLFKQSIIPVTLGRSGKIRSPFEVSQAMGEALADSGNGCPESSPMPLGAQCENRPALCETPVQTALAHPPRFLPYLRRFCGVPYAISPRALSPRHRAKACSSSKRASTSLATTAPA